LIVIDASVMVEVLLNTSTGMQISPFILSPGTTLHAPHLLDLEVAQALRRYRVLGELESTRTTEAIHTFQDFSITRYRHDLFLTRIWELRHNYTAYDAAYLALSEALGALFVTRNSALASTTRHRARVKLV